MDCLFHLVLVRLCKEKIWLDHDWISIYATQFKMSKGLSLKFQQLQFFTILPLINQNISSEKSKSRLTSNFTFNGGEAYLQGIPQIKMRSQNNTSDVVINHWVSSSLIFRPGVQSLRRASVWLLRLDYYCIWLQRLESFGQGIYLSKILCHTGFFKAIPKLIL